MAGHALIEGPIALIGANGMLAQKVRSRAPQGVAVHGFDLPGFDMTDAAAVQAAMTELRPAVIINCAAFTAVDACETQEALATRVNADGVASLAAAARQLDAVLVHISTDYVFAGDQARPYREDDPTGPLSAYGRSKLLGERAILASGLERYLIIRTSWLYGPGGNNFVETILRLAAERDELRIIADQVGGPTYTGDLAEAIFNLLALAVHGQGESPLAGTVSSPVTSPQPPVASQGDSPHAGTVPYGIYHFANAGQCSWYEFACAIVEEGRSRGLPLKVREIRPISTAEYPLPAKRPANSVFDTAKYLAATGAEIPAWRASLKGYFAERTHSGPGDMKHAGH